MAWESILEEREPLDLSPYQVRQAETQREAASSAVAARIPETWQWLLVPVQARPDASIEWSPIRLTGQDSLAARASKRLKGDELQPGVREGAGGNPGLDGPIRSWRAFPRQRRPAPAACGAHAVAGCPMIAPVRGSRRTAANMALAATAMTTKSTLKPQVAWIPAMTGRVEAMTENVTM